MKYQICGLQFLEDISVCDENCEKYLETGNISIRYRSNRSNFHVLICFENGRV